MKWYQENFGEDMDGNRGMTMWFYELEPSDKDMVLEAIKNYMNETGYDDYSELPSHIEVPMINPYTEDQEWVEIVIKEWI